MVTSDAEDDRAIRDSGRILDTSDPDDTIVLTGTWTNRDVRALFVLGSLFGIANGALGLSLERAPA
jgi:hypothetical protein